MARDDKGPSDWMRYSHLGIQFVVILLLAVFGGLQLDKKLSTGGLFTLLGTFVGAGIAFYLLYRETQSVSGSDPRDSRSADVDSGGGSGDSDRTDRRS
jgi:F0F1-type ATP synthase assembly protein I